MKNKYYIYRFLDKDNNILYLGRTNDIERRILKEHFTALGHLPIECYRNVTDIEYTVIENESEEVAYEAIMINQLKPKYNKQFKDYGLFEIELPRFEWNKFKFAYDGELEYLKARKNETPGIDCFVNNRLEKNNNVLYTGFVGFDEKSPINETDLILLAGETNSLKTTCALNICNYISKFTNKKILYVNLKNSAEQLTDKIIAMETLLPVKDVGNLIKENKDMLHLVRNIEFTNLAYQDKNIDKIVEIIKNGHYDFVIVDDLQSIVNQKDIYIKDKMLEIMQKLKSLTLNIRVPVLVISNVLLKNSLLRADKRLMISDLEYESLQSMPDKIIFLHTYDLELEELKDRVEVIVAKNNIGRGYVFNNLLFVASCCILVNIE